MGCARLLGCRPRGSVPFVFGISLTEIMMIAVIALVVVGPQKLPGMLRTLDLSARTDRRRGGARHRKLRRLTTEVRAQTGIDEILREEGIDGVHELRSLLRGEIAAARRRPTTQPREDPYLEALEFDQGREYPVEGADSYGAMPDDLIDDDEETEEAAADASDPDRTAAETTDGDKQGADTETRSGGDDNASEPSELLTANSLSAVEASPPKTS